MGINRAEDFNGGQCKQETHETDNLCSVISNGFPTNKTRRVVVVLPSFSSPALLLRTVWILVWHVFRRLRPRVTKDEERK